MANNENPRQDGDQTAREAQDQRINTFTIAKVRLHWPALVAHSELLSTDLNASGREWHAALVVREQEIRGEMLAAQDILAGGTDMWLEELSDQTTTRHGLMLLLLDSDSLENAEPIGATIQSWYEDAVQQIRLLVRAAADREVQLLDSLRLLRRQVTADVVQQVKQARREAQDAMWRYLGHQAIGFTLRAGLSDAPAANGMEAALSDLAWLATTTARLEALDKEAKNRAQTIFMTANRRFETEAAANLAALQELWRDVGRRMEELAAAGTRLLGGPDPEEQ